MVSPMREPSIFGGTSNNFCILIAENTSIYPKQLRKVKLPVQNMRLEVQNGEIENNCQNFMASSSKFISDKQNGG